jgi:proline dehydrogenase
MYDELTNKLVDSTRSDSPFVLKYVPYGGLKEVCASARRRYEFG